MARLVAILLSALVVLVNSVDLDKQEARVLDALVGAIEGPPFKCSNPAFASEVEALQEQLQGAQANQTAMIQSVTAAKADVVAKTKAKEDAQKKREGLQTRFASFDAKKEAAEEKLAQLKKSKAAVEKRIEKQQKLMKRMLADIEDAQQLKQLAEEKRAGLTAQIEQRKQQLQTAQEEARDKEDEAKELTTQESDLENIVRGLQQQVLQATRETKDALAATRAARYALGSVELEHSDPVAETEFTAAQDLLGELETKKSNLETQLAGVKAEQDASAKLQETLTNQRKELQQTIDGVGYNTTSLEKEVSALSAQLSAAQSALARLELFEGLAKKAVAAIKLKYDQLTAKKSKLVEKTLPALDSTLKKHEENIATFNEKAEKARAENDDLVTEQGRLENQLTSLKEQAVELSAEQSELSATLKDLQKALSKVKKEMIRTDGQITSQKEAEGRLSAAVVKVQRIVNKATKRIRAVNEAREDLAKKKRALITRGECGPGTNDRDCDVALEALDDSHRLVIDGIVNGRGAEILQAEREARAEEKEEKMRQMRSMGENTGE